MATIIDRPQTKSDAGSAPDAFEVFANELTELCRKHGVGVEGALAYAASAEDLAFRYRCEDNGELIRVH
jgi:hypothetical protein